MRLLLGLVIACSILLPRLGSETLRLPLPVLSDFKNGSRVEIYPVNPLQGGPVLVFVGVTDGEKIKTVSVGTTILGTFLYKGGYASLYGIDLRAATGTKVVLVKFANGKEIKSNFLIAERPDVTAPLGIPKKLGGNTMVSQTRLVNNLIDENNALNAIPSGEKALWDKSFISPLASTTVTDAYGYSRLTGSYSIAHKGTDFRAAIGTFVLAMNSGVVRLAREFRVYGKTIVIDHGLGVQTLYMHLSQIDVKVGQMVERGQAIGLSGNSGYAESPHLHAGVRIGGVSIDPISFLSLFK